MTLGAASTLKDGTQDFKNGHYLSGGFKLISPFIIPAFAKAPGMMIRGMVGGSLADNWSNYMWARTAGRGKTFAQDISDATGGRISEEEGHILNPATWWGFKMGMDSHRWRPNGILGMNEAIRKKKKATVKTAGKKITEPFWDTNAFDLVKVTDKG